MSLLQGLSGIICYVSVILLWLHLLCLIGNPTFGSSPPELGKPWLPQVHCWNLNLPYLRKISPCSKQKKLAFTFCLLSFGHDGLGLLPSLGLTAASPQKSWMLLSLRRASNKSPSCCWVCLFLSLKIQESDVILGCTVRSISKLPRGSKVAQHEDTFILRCNGRLVQSSEDNVCTLLGKPV